MSAHPLAALTDEIEKALAAWKGCPAYTLGRCARDDCDSSSQRYGQCRARAEYIAGRVAGIIAPAKTTQREWDGAAVEAGYASLPDYVARYGEEKP